MRVLMLSWEYPPHVVGGLGKHVQELVPALADLGIDLHVFTPRWLGGSDREVIDGTTIHRVDPPPHSELTDFFTDTQRTNGFLQEEAAARHRERGRLRHHPRPRLADRLCRHRPQE